MAAITRFPWAPILVNTPTDDGGVTCCHVAPRSPLRSKPSVPAYIVVPSANKLPTAKLATPRLTGRHEAPSSVDLKMPGERLSTLATWLPDPA